MEISAFAQLYQFRSHSLFDIGQIIKLASFSISFIFQIKNILSSIFQIKILFLEHYILVEIALRKKIQLLK